MNTLRTAHGSALRRLALAAVLAVACVAATAQAAGAAAQIIATTSNTQAGAPVKLMLRTSLSGTGNATRQYGAAIAVPKTLQIKYSTYGTTSQMCSGAAIQPMSTGITPDATSFDPSLCPAEAVVGTVSRGPQSGLIYLVNTTPMPSLGLYFDTGGYGTPYGRGMQIDYQGSVQVLRVNGLSNLATSGLTMTFENLSRPSGLQPQLWNWAPPDDLSVCKPSSIISGGVYTYPTSGTAADSVAAQPKTITTNGCGISFKLTTGPKVAGTTTALKIETPLAGAGNDRLQYGASVTTTAALFPKYVNFGSSSQMCSGASVQPMTTGYYPEPTSFDVSTCPATANVGTASIGGMTGNIYTVNTMPVPSFGVWFDSGVAVPFGRALSVDWNASVPKITVLGLPNVQSAGLTLNFDNPSRPTLPSKVWAFAEPGVSQCASGNAKGTVYTYPASGSAIDTTYPQNVFLSLTGC